MRILIAGMDGYLGWSLALHLGGLGHEVGGIDNFARRRWVEEMGSHSAIPIKSMKERMAAFKAHFGSGHQFWEGDLTDYGLVVDIVEQFQPDAIVHLGECASAPYSMIDRDHAVGVQLNNIVSTFNLIFAIRDVRPDTHLLKLGTMGEYGAPNIDIPEGFFDIEYRGRRDRMPFPRQAGSWYHWSKVHGSNNIMFASRQWGLRATDIMQGVVYGTRIGDMRDDDTLATRLDFDQAFGTVMNRFCCEAVIGHPLTPFGSGHQKRSFIPLRDSIQCLTLALQNSPETGEYRVLNQFDQVYSVDQLAKKVQSVGGALGLDVQIQNLENPRNEPEEHRYQPDHQKLFDLGYRPSHTLDEELTIMIGDLIKHRSRIEEKSEVLIPDIRWVGQRHKVELLEKADPVA